MTEQLIILIEIILIDLVLAGDNAIIIGMVASKFDSSERNKIIFWGRGGAVILRIIDNSNFKKAILTVILADVTMSLDNVLGVAGAAKDHYILLAFGLGLSILLMAFAANYTAKLIKKYSWISWVGLLAILIVAIELIYTDLKILL